MLGPEAIVRVVRWQRLIAAKALLEDAIDKQHDLDRAMYVAKAALRDAKRSGIDSEEPARQLRRLLKGTQDNVELG
jgi:hypothetical protein